MKLQRDIGVSQQRSKIPLRRVYLCLTTVSSMKLQRDIGASRPRGSCFTAGGRR